MSCGRVSAGTSSGEGAGGTAGSVDSGVMDAEIDDTDPDCPIPVMPPFEFTLTGPAHTADDSCELVYRDENQLKISRADGSNAASIAHDVEQFELVNATGGVVYWNTLSTTAHYRDAFGRGSEISIDSAWSRTAPGLGLLVYALDVNGARREIWTLDLATRRRRTLLPPDDYSEFLFFGPGLVYHTTTSGPFWASLTTSVRASFPSPESALLAVDAAGTRAIHATGSVTPTSLVLMDLEGETTVPLELPAPNPDWLSGWSLNLTGSFSQDGRFIRVDWCIRGQEFDMGSPRTELYETLGGEHLASIEHQFYYYGGCGALGYPTTRTGILLPTPEGTTYFGFTGKVGVVSSRQNLTAHAAKERDGNERWLVTQQTDRGASTLVMTETAPGVFELGPELAGGDVRRADNAGRWFLARPAGIDTSADSDQWVLIDVDSGQVLPVHSNSGSVRVFANGRALLRQESLSASVTNLPNL